jgi:uncharacterized protein (TIGR00251 family)
MAIIITVTVRPNAATSGLVQISPAEYKASVKALPEKGKANKAVIELLADHFGVARSAVTILHGQNKKKKLIRID